MTAVYIKRLSDGEKAHDAELSMLEKGLAEKSGQNLYEKNITVSEKGKPLFADGFPHFNFSNCRGFAAVALSDHEVGVDIERIRKISDKVCERYLHKTPPGDKERTVLWTKYESLGKMVGIGIPHDLDGRGANFHTKLKGDIVITVCSAEKECFFEWL